MGEPPELPLNLPLQCAPNHLWRTEQCWPLHVNWANTLCTYLKVMHYLENSLVWIFIHPLFWLYGSPLISYSVTVWFPLKRNSPGCSGYGLGYMGYRGCSYSLTATCAWLKVFKIIPQFRNLRLSRNSIDVSLKMLN